MMHTMKRMIAALLLVVMMITALPIMAPALAETIRAQVTASSGVMVYERASTSSEKLGKLSKGAQVNVVSTSGSWAHVERNGVYGYCKTSALTIVQATPTKKPSLQNAQLAEVNVSSTMVYELPSTSSTKLGSIKRDTLVNVIRTSNGWAYIELNGRYGYCKTSALLMIVEATPEPTKAPDRENWRPAKTRVSGVKVYEKSTTSSKLLGTMGKNVQVNLISDDGRWAYIELNGRYGYCQLSALTLIEVTPKPTATATPKPTDAPEDEDNMIPAEVTASSVMVYKKASTSSAQLGKLSRGAMVNIISTSGSWAYIERAGRYGYCKLSALTVIEDEPEVTPTPKPTDAPTDDPEADWIPAKVTASSVMVYKKASTSSEKLGKLNRGATVNIIDIDGDWAYIERAGRYGYCDVDALTETDATPEPTLEPDEDYAVEAIVNANTKVYKKASSSSASASVKKGTLVYVLETGERWSFIRSTAGVEAYIKTKYLSIVEDLPEYEEIPLEIPIPAVVVTKQAAVFAEPVFWSETIGTLKKDAKVKIIATIEDETWVKIDYNGKEGWVALETLEIDEDFDPLEGFKKETFGATVVTQNALFFNIATDDDGVKIPFGTNVTVTAYNAELAFVTVADMQGFVLVKDLSRTTYKELSIGNSSKEIQNLEKALLGGGYFDGRPGDSFTEYTEAAVKRLQLACGQTATGVATEGVQRMIFSGNAPTDPILTATFKKGDKGDNVKRVQTRLFALGYFSKSSSIDSSMGDTTVRAISLFQANNDMEQTGVADPATLKKMYSVGAVTLPANKVPADMGGVIIQPESGNQQNNSTKISETLASVTSQYYSGMSGAEKLEYAIYNGQNQLGKPYVYGASGPNSYDCTGFTCYCFDKIGIKLKRTAQTQGYDETYPKIESISELKRGDLVFLNTVDDSDLSDHSGIYLGAGWFIHSSSGQGKVVVSTLTSGYYNRVFSWGRRVFD